MRMRVMRMFEAVCRWTWKSQASSLWQKLAATKTSPAAPTSTDLKGGVRFIRTNFGLRIAQGAHVPLRLEL